MCRVYETPGRSRTSGHEVRTVVAFGTSLSRSAELSSLLGRGGRKVQTRLSFWSLVVAKCRTVIVVGVLQSCRRFGSLVGARCRAVVAFWGPDGTKCRTVVRFWASLLQNGEMLQLFASWTREMRNCCDFWTGGFLVTCLVVEHTKYVSEACWSSGLPNP